MGSVSATLVPDIKVELVAVIVSFTPAKPRFSTSATTNTEFQIWELSNVEVVVVSVVLDVLLPQPSIKQRITNFLSLLANRDGASDL